jgi:hypothetical protein
MLLHNIEEQGHKDLRYQATEPFWMMAEVVEWPLTKTTRLESGSRHSILRGLLIYKN